MTTRLFVGEFITGGGLCDKALPASLAAEGNMMLDAMLGDFVDVAGIELVTTRDQRLAPPRWPVECVFAEGCIEYVWRACMDDADAVIIIAPEQDGVLARLTMMAEHSDCQVWGSASPSVRRATSKLETAKLLAAHGIPHIETRLLQEGILPASDSGWVIKPDDGVGAEDCYFAMDEQGAFGLKNTFNSRRFIIQKFIKGVHASLSMLCYRGSSALLACNRQYFGFEHGRGVLRGLAVNGLVKHWAAFEAVAGKIAASDHGLTGYVGVDLIVNEAGPVVVEINPRLTTSYAGLRRSLSVNPAQFMLSVLRGEGLPRVDGAQCLHIELPLTGI